MREACSLAMIPHFSKKVLKVKYFDPTGPKKEFSKHKNVEYCSNIELACLNSDLIILHTEWNEFKLLNFKKLVRKKNFIIYDMRNLYSPINMKKNKIKYFGVGR